VDDVNTFGDPNELQVCVQPETLSIDDQDLATLEPLGNGAVEDEEEDDEEEVEVEVEVEAKVEVEVEDIDPSIQMKAFKTQERIKKDEAATRKLLTKRNQEEALRRRSFKSSPSSLLKP